MPPKIDAPIPGTDEATLAEVTGTLTSVPAVGASIPDRFVEGVRSLVEARAQTGWPNEASGEDFAAFIFIDRPREVGSKHGAEPITDPSASRAPLLGRVFFMNRDASNGYSLALPTAPSCLIDWLADNQLGSWPVIMVYRQTWQMTARRNGINGNADTITIRARKPTATIEELQKMLEFFHLGQLTPTCCSHGVWETSRSSHYVPGPDPERVIQRAMTDAARFWFHGVVRAEMEDTVSIGRIDIRLLTPSEGGGLQYWAVIELKVLRSFSNASIGTAAKPVGRTTNVDAIVKGIQQSWAFRQNRSAEGGLVEIFDLRKDKDEDLMLDEKVKEAIVKCTPSPMCSLRPIYGSADDARKAGFSGL